MKITAALLQEKDACEIQVRRFEDLFPNGVEITQELCVQHARSFDWNWAAENLLSPDKYADYEAKAAALYADYEAKTAALYADYGGKLAPFDAAYKAKVAALFASLAE